MKSSIGNRLQKHVLFCCVIAAAAATITCSKSTDQSSKADAATTVAIGPIDFKAVSDSLQNLGMVVGATYDRAHGRLNLIGNGEHKECSPSMQQIAVAFRWAFADSPRANYVSIDPWPDNPRAPWMTVRINRDAYDTDFGWIMFEADRLMKCYSLGIDNVIGAAVASTVPGYMNMMQISLSMAANARKQEVWSRFWLYPRNNTVEATDDAMRIGAAAIGVRTETMRWQGRQLVPAGNLRDEAAEKFAAFFTEHYTKFADEEPVFRQLEQLMRLLLVSEWIRENTIPVNLDWIERFREETFRLPRVTPALNVSQEQSQRSSNVIRKQIVNLFGGTDLDVKPNYVSISNDFPTGHQTQPGLLEAQHLHLSQAECAMLVSLCPPVVNLSQVQMPRHCFSSTYKMGKRFN
jgi:hypothetical protein